MSMFDSPFYYFNRSDLIIINSTGINNTQLCGPFRNESITAVFSDFLEHMEENHGTSTVGRVLRISTSHMVTTPIVFVMM